MWPFFARTIAAIATVDPNHLFFVESTLFGATATAMVPLHAADLVYAPHLYTGALVPAVLTPGPNPLQQSVRERAREAAILPAALWFGELGIQHSPDVQREGGIWADDALDQLDAAGSGWAWWQWRVGGGWGIRSESGGTLDLAFLRHLARPYLAAAPGGIRASGADGLRGRLDLSVGAGGSRTALVSWPALTLPPPAVHGSCATATGYDPATGLLTLDVAAGPGCELTLQAT
jgi:hypothetical protein